MYKARLANLWAAGDVEHETQHLSHVQARLLHLTIPCRPDLNSKSPRDSLLVGCNPWFPLLFLEVFLAEVSF